MMETTGTAVTGTISLCIKGATLTVGIEGLRQRNLNAILNAAFMFAASFLPDIAERRYDIELQPWQRLYAELAMLAHAAGFLGPYDEIWWWDHVTHVLSASLLGGGIHVAARRRGRNARRDVLVGVVGGGILWEVTEYAIHQVSDRLGIEPMLVYYGRRDTLKDLLFNLLGTVLVLIFGDCLLQNVTRNAD